MLFKNGSGGGPACGEVEAVGLGKALEYFGMGAVNVITLKRNHFSHPFGYVVIIRHFICKYKTNELYFTVQFYHGGML